MGLYLASSKMLKELLGDIKNSMASADKTLSEKCQWIMAWKRIALVWCGIILNFKYYIKLIKYMFFWIIKLSIVMINDN